LLFAAQPDERCRNSFFFKTKQQQPWTLPPFFNRKIFFFNTDEAGRPLDTPLYELDIVYAETPASGSSECSYSRRPVASLCLRLLKKEETETEKRDATSGPSSSTANLRSLPRRALVVQVDQKLLDASAPPHHAPAPMAALPPEIEELLVILKSWRIKYHL
jgi:hypothetical protein